MAISLVIVPPRPNPIPPAASGLQATKTNYGYEMLPRNVDVTSLRAKAKGDRAARKAKGGAKR